MFDLLELGETGVRIFGFWRWVFSAKYRSRVAVDLRSASPGRRTLLLLEHLVSCVLGVGLPFLVWITLS